MLFINIKRHKLVKFLAKKLVDYKNDQIETFAVSYEDICKELGWSKKTLDIVRSGIVTKDKDDPKELNITRHPNPLGLCATVACPFLRQVVS